MLNTSEYIELAETIGDEILSLQIYKTYKQLQEKIYTDKEISTLIQQFEKAKLAYQDVERYGFKYHPDYKEVSKQLIEAKSNLYQHEIIKELKKYEKEIQQVLDEIANYMSQSIEFTVNKNGGSCGCGSGNCSR